MRMLSRRSVSCRILQVGLCLGLGFVTVNTTLGAGLDSTGNTDGVLTWRIGTLDAGESARRVVLFVFDDSHEAVVQRLDAARKQFAASSEVQPPKTEPPASDVVWIKNDTTELGLAGPGHFFWEGQRQGLTSAKGGQLSRFAYYVHYDDGARRRCGTPVTDKRPENLSIVVPLRAISKTEAVVTVAAVDEKLRVRIRAIMGEGPVAGVEFLLTNTSKKQLADVRLSAYANLEAAHSHGNDYSMLDDRTGGLLTVDPSSGICVVMAGLDRPVSGYSGNWPSGGQLQNATGIGSDTWSKFVAIPDTIKQQLARAPMPSVPHAPAGRLEPIEPETRDLTAEEALAVLHRDWLFQADDRPTLARALQEIEWARQLAARLAKNPKTEDLSAERNALDTLQKQIDEQGRAGGASAEEVQEAYLAVRKVKRRIVLKNPAVNFSKVLLIDNPYPQGAEWPHQARHRNGMMAVPGGRLLVLDGLHPGGHVRKLAPQKPGSFWRPDLSFDAKRVLFCYKAHDEKSFHLHEIDTDGGNLRQLTEGDYDDIDPIYLPDGHLLFSTTRGNTYVRCMPYTYSYVLGRCDADGKEIYLVSRNNEPDWCPTLLNDGRVCYSRWEYHDKALWRIQSLWTMNTDGTAVSTFWGNQSVWPDHLAEPRPIPGSRRVMFTGLAHHDWFAGSIGILNPDEGFNFPDGLTKVTSDVAWPECGTPPSDPHETEDYHASGRYAAYKTPYPLSEEDFLVSARTGGRMDKFKLYLMDVHGNRELIYEGHYNVWHAMPVVPRPRPPVHVDRVAWPGTGEQRGPQQPGVIYNSNVYQGIPELTKGIVKHLRVIQMDAKTYSTWQRDAAPNLFSGPAISIVQAEGVKRILGTVPVQPDGSVAVRVPSGKALHFQLLDERYRAVHTMRSFTGVMPGERRGCVGCHELHSSAPVAGMSPALRRPPSDLTPPPWGVVSLSYERHVQPILDRYCGECHQGEGEAREDFDLTLRPGFGAFKEPYVSLIGHARYAGKVMAADAPHHAGAFMVENYGQTDPNAYKTTRPMQHLSYTSRLVEFCADGKHHKTRLDPNSLRQIIGWVDANCPYRGDEDVRAIADPDFAGIEQLPIRPRTATAPKIQRP